MEEEFFAITFEQEGTLGIEFKNFFSPYEVVTGMNEQTSVLKKGDLMIKVNDTLVEGVPWETLKPLLVSRPVTVTFHRQKQGDGWSSWGWGGQTSGLIGGTTTLLSSAKVLGSTLVSGLSDALQDEDDVDAPRADAEIIPLSPDQPTVSAASAAPVEPEELPAAVSSPPFVLPAPIQSVPLASVAPVVPTVPHMEVVPVAPVTPLGGVIPLTPPTVVLAAPTTPLQAVDIAHTSKPLAPPSLDVEQIHQTSPAKGSVPIFPTSPLLTVPASMQPVPIAPTPLAILAAPSVLPPPSKGGVPVVPTSAGSLPARPVSPMEDIPMSPLSRDVRGGLTSAVTQELPGAQGVPAQGAVLRAEDDVIIPRTPPSMQAAPLPVTPTAMPVLQSHSQARGAYVDDCQRAVDSLEGTGSMPTDPPVGGGGDIALSDADAEVFSVRAHAARFEADIARLQREKDRGSRGGSPVGKPSRMGATVDTTHRDIPGSGDPFRESQTPSSPSVQLSPDTVGSGGAITQVPHSNAAENAEMRNLREELSYARGDRDQLSERLRLEHAQELASLRRDISAMQDDKYSAIEYERHMAEQRLQETSNQWMERERQWREQMEQGKRELAAALAKTEEACRAAESLELDVSHRKRYELKIASLQAELLEKSREQEARTNKSTYEYEVTFAVRGPLGLEFEDAAKPPYVVAKIHPNCVASNWNIKTGDEVMKIGTEAVPHKWVDFVASMAPRPVTVTFKRAEQAATGTTYLDKMRLWGTSSDSSRLQEELGETRRQRDEAQNMLKSTEDVLSTMMQTGADATLQQAVAVRLQLETRVRSMEEEVQEEREKNDARSQQFAELRTQFEALQASNVQLAADSEEKTRLQAEVARLEQVNTQWQDASQAQKEQLCDLRDAHAALSGKQSGDCDADTRIRLEEEKRCRTEEVEHLLQANREKDAELDQLRSILETFREEQMFGEGKNNAALELQLSENRDLRRQIEKLEEAQKAADRRGGHDRMLALEAQVRQLSAESEAQIAEMTRLRDNMISAQDVSQQAVSKLRKDMEDRPYLIDKRLCVQMLTQYLCAPYATRGEILGRMADSLGFTNEDRAQIGLKAGVLRQTETNIGDEFLSFLEEEAM